MTATPRDWLGVAVLAFERGSWEAALAAADAYLSIVEAFGVRAVAASEGYRRDTVTKAVIQAATIRREAARRLAEGPT